MSVFMMYVMSVVHVKLFGKGTRMKCFLLVEFLCCADDIFTLFLIPSFLIVFCSSIISITLVCLYLSVVWRALTAALDHVDTDYSAQVITDFHRVNIRVT